MIIFSLQNRIIGEIVLLVLLYIIFRFSKLKSHPQFFVGISLIVITVYHVLLSSFVSPLCVNELIVKICAGIYAPSYSLSIIAVLIVLWSFFTIHKKEQKRVSEYILIQKLAETALYSLPLIIAGSMTYYNSGLLSYTFALFGIAGILLAWRGVETYTVDMTVWLSVTALVSLNYEYGIYTLAIPFYIFVMKNIIESK